MQRIPSLDGLRAISVSLVMAGHLARAGRFVPHFFAAYALTGVYMFFVISGYLITTILLNEHARTSSINLREFYIRRAYRILPAAAVFMVFAVIAYWHELRWLDILAMFLYLMNYDSGWPWMVGHLWTLSVEEQFYLLWPSALKRFFRYRVEILGATIALSPVFVAIARYLKAPSSALSSFPAAADHLAIGCLLAIFITLLPRIRGWVALVMLLTVVLIPFYPIHSRTGVVFRTFALGPLLNFSVAGILLHVLQRPYRILHMAPVVWLGKLSYSLYLWQQPFFAAPSGQPAYKLLFGVGLACASYYLVERPVLRLREKRTPRLRPGTTLAGST